MTSTENRADGDLADQPCSLNGADQSPTSTRGDPARGRIAMIAVPVFVLIVTVAAFQTANDRADAPPAMQAMLAPRSATAVPTESKSEPTDVESLIRVNVTPGGVDSLQLEVRGACDWVSFDSDAVVLDDPPRGIIRVDASARGLRLGSRQLETSRMEVRPRNSPAIRVNGHLYRGIVRLFRRTDGKVSAVNILPIEEYLASVVDSEMPASFPESARQAQAIVARTYALYQARQADPAAVYDLLASQRSQKYLGVEYVDRSGRRLAGESVSSRRAVASTRGLVCQRRGQLFCTYYSAVCGGRTTDGRSVFKDAIDVVRSVPCEWCRESPHYRWKAEISLAEFQRRILDPKARPDRRLKIQLISHQAGIVEGRIPEFDFSDGVRHQSFSGIELREKLSGGTLASPHFRIELDDNVVRFEGRGHGHGVGFCQWGAKGQAEEGKDAREIVLYYYPGADVAKWNAVSKGNHDQK